MATTLHDDHVLRVDYDEVHDWLLVCWRPHQDLQTSRHGCQVLLNCLHQQPCRRLFNDSRAVSTFWADAAEWIGTTFADQLIQAGVERIAWLNGANLYDRLSTRQTVAYIGKPLAQIFDDYEEALRWLAADGVTTVSQCKR